MISDRLKKVILAELDLTDCPMIDTTVAAEVPGWDSLRHAAIIAAVETEFSVRFRTLEILRLKSLGDLQAAVDAKVKDSR